MDLEFDAHHSEDFCGGDVVDFALFPLVHLASFDGACYVEARFLCGLAETLTEVIVVRGQGFSRKCACGWLPGESPCKCLFAHVRRGCTLILLTILGSLELALFDEDGCCTRRKTWARF